jgi:hypothetical protein
MITIDRQLLFAARQMITGANVHAINTLIFQYETAARISREEGTSDLDAAAKEYERRLRHTVRQEAVSRVRNLPDSRSNESEL